MILRLALALLLLCPSVSEAAEARIVKVLNHLIDAQGRTSLAPSLFERDAYQLHLRSNPELAAGTRFDVQYKASRSEGPVLVRLEIRGSKTGLGSARTYESEFIPSRWGSSWARIMLDQATSESLGSVVAWRATLWRGDVMIAEKLSFLW